MCISSLVTGVSACVGGSTYGYKCSDVSRCTDNENGVVYHKSNSCTSCSSTITDVSGTAVYSCQSIPDLSGWGPNGPGYSCSINGVNTDTFFCKYKDACDIYYGCSAGCVQKIHGTDCVIAPSDGGFALGQSLSCGVFNLGSLEFGQTGLELSRNICGSADWRRSITGLILGNFNKFCYDLSLVGTRYPVVAGGCLVSTTNNQWFELTDIPSPIGLDQLSLYPSVRQVVQCIDSTAAVVVNVSRDCKLCYPKNWPVWIQCGSSDATRLGVSCASTEIHYKCVSDGVCPYTLGVVVNMIRILTTLAHPLTPKIPRWAHRLNTPAYPLLMDTRLLARRLRNPQNSLVIKIPVDCFMDVS